MVSFTRPRASDQKAINILEEAIVNGTPAVIAIIRLRCKTTSGSNYNDSDFDAILRVCFDLNFDFVKLELLTYHDARPEPRDGASTVPAVVP